MTCYALLTLVLIGGILGYYFEADDADSTINSLGQVRPPPKPRSKIGAPTSLRKLPGSS
eukprot:COSAG04_NODE_1110_length_8228_cov_3.329315_3_plen_59_part_00